MDASVTIGKLFTQTVTSSGDALSSNTVLDATKVDIEAGDILRLDITSVQTNGNGFLVRVDYNRS